MQQSMCLFLMQGPNCFSPVSLPEGENRTQTRFFPEQKLNTMAKVLIRMPLPLKLEGLLASLY